MKLSKFFTKIFVAIAFIAALSIFNIFSLPNKAKAATLPVQLYYSKLTPDYNSYNTSHVEGYIAVQNLAFEKKVTVHYTIDGKTWSDVPASYLKTDTNDNCDIWKFMTPSAYPGQKVTFCIKYEVNGQTYWDNNDGENYTNTAFGKSSVFVNSVDGFTDSRNKRISLFIATNYTSENIINSNPVKVRYTEDNWKTYKDIPANFLSSGCTDSNLEWSANIDVSKSTKHVEFAVAYELNGVEYWDNNFGSNYTVNF